MSESDRQYYRRRAQEERSCAEGATHPAATSAHLEIAERYADLAGAVHKHEKVRVLQAAGS